MSQYNTLEKIHRGLDNKVLKVLRKYGVNYLIHTPVSIKTINNYNKQIEYTCETNSHVIKDNSNVNESIGIIYNIVDDVLLVGTLGVGYLNSKYGLLLPNKYLHYSIYSNINWLEIANLLVDLYCYNNNMNSEEIKEKIKNEIEGY